jgi:putative FmdB family regulatory protein
VPTYRYRCDHDGDFDVWQSIQATALTECPHCDGPVLKVMVPPNISATAMPNRGRAVVSVDETERRWDRDHAAYKRLVRDGCQPKALDGAADLEAKANSRLEIRRGRLYDNQALKEAADQASNMLGEEIAV